jgi:tetrahydromethanopterin S-methyltransferase subunit C
MPFSMFLSIITLPTGFVADITGNSSQLFTDLAPIIALVAGVLLGAIVISLVIQAIKR